MKDLSLKDKKTLRGLAMEYMELAGKPVQKERAGLWRKLNSLKMERPPIQAMTHASFWETQAESVTMADPFWRGVEWRLRQDIYMNEVGGDYVLKPYYLIPPKYKEGYIGGESNTKLWGVTLKIERLNGGSMDFFGELPIKELSDTAKLVVPRHSIDDAKMDEEAGRVEALLGDIIPVVKSRAPFYRSFHGDICSDLIKLRGQEQVLMDMYDNPEWLHGLLAFLRDGVLANQEEAERAGDFRTVDHFNQAEPYVDGLPAPDAEARSVGRRQLWGFAASQEYTMVSPEFFDEFLLQYQIPILERYGLSAYGCCEDLTKKIGLLRKIPNLRRIAVTPFAKVAGCAEAIGHDYVVSYRPNPTDIISCGFSPERVRSILRRDLTELKANGCDFDITLKDVSTVERDPRRAMEWLRIANEVIDELY